MNYWRNSRLFKRYRAIFFTRLIEPLSNTCPIRYRNSPSLVRSRYIRRTHRLSDHIAGQRDSISLSDFIPDHIILPGRAPGLFHSHNRILESYYFPLAVYPPYERLYRLLACVPGDHTTYFDRARRVIPLIWPYSRLFHLSNRVPGLYTLVWPKRDLFPLANV